jgi:hypothetical protein
LKIGKIVHDSARENFLVRDGARVHVKEGCSAHDILLRMSASKMCRQGVEFTDVRALGFDFPSLKDAGFDLSAFKTAGCDWASIRTAGFTAAEAKAAGCDLSTALFSGFDIPSLIAPFGFDAVAATGCDMSPFAAFKGRESDASSCVLVR